MSPISNSTSTNIPMPVSKVSSKDSDGDKDGTTRAQASAPTKPIGNKPTATMGNMVNTFA